jgi:hypothetical protein
MSSKRKSMSKSKLQISPHLPYSSSHSCQHHRPARQKTGTSNRQPVPSPNTTPSPTQHTPSRSLQYNIHHHHRSAPPSHTRQHPTPATAQSIAKLPHHQRARAGPTSSISTLSPSLSLSPHRTLPPSHIAALPLKLKLLLLAAHLDTIGVTSLQTRSASPAAVTTAS